MSNESFTETTVKHGSLEMPRRAQSPRLEGSELSCVLEANLTTWGSLLLSVSGAHQGSPFRRLLGRWCPERPKVSNQRKPSFLCVWACFWALWCAGGRVCLPSAALGRVMRARSWQSWSSASARGRPWRSRAHLTCSLVVLGLAKEAPLPSSLP